MQLLSLGKNPLASLFLAVVPPNSECQVECARITTKTLEQTLCPLVECAAVSIEGRGEKIGQRLLFLEWSRVIRILMRELIINVIIGSSPPRNTDRPGGDGSFFQVGGQDHCSLVVVW
jgi:hypothetical protein